MTKIKLKQRKTRNGGTIKRLHKSSLINALGSDKIITFDFTRWLETHDNPALKPETIEFGRKIMEGWAEPRDRAVTWNASDIHRCKRWQIFRRLGGGGRKISSEQANLFHDGHWRHLRWQMRLFDAGLISDAEDTWHGSFVLPVAGTPDGLQPSGKYGFELKGARSGSWTYVANTGPMKDHLLQVAAYFCLAEDLDFGYRRWSLVYEHKDTQEWHEWVLERGDTPMKKVRAIVSDLERAWNNHEMPERLQQFDEEPKRAPCSRCLFLTDCDKIPEGGWIEDLIPDRPTRAQRKIKIVRS